MKKIKTLKNFVICETNENERKKGLNNFIIFTKEEYSFGDGCRYHDYDAGSIREAEEFINNY
jgi:hypothetical protein